MILKILEEMRQVRLQQNYVDYRTLKDVLVGYLREAFYNPNLKESNINIGLLKNIIKWMDSEIMNLDEMIEESLKEKKYKQLKIASQVYMDLKYECGKLAEIGRRL